MGFHKGTEKREPLVDEFIVSTTLALAPFSNFSSFLNGLSISIFPFLYCFPYVQPSQFISPSNHSYEERSKFQIVESAAYFIGRCKAIAADEDYIPTIKDVLRVRVRTSGIVEEQYIIEDVTFVMYDVGGQRNERKKWIHCFDKVSAVIFVAALSEYDQALFEDHETNRMTEALNLFAEICNSRWFTETVSVFVSLMYMSGCI